MPQYLLFKFLDDVYFGLLKYAVSREFNIVCMFSHATFFSPLNIGRKKLCNGLLRGGLNGAV